ncbi:MULTISPECIES: signal peptidase I [Thermotoga]|jgi:signal peptidase I|nr:MULTISPECIES: signal peptidase I [Thermotoga]MDK2785841.1 signal peptidase [Thermotoga sp.]HBF11397.1 signal peptidase I [Thermotoga neapolitana]AJG41246.1 signal peptidase I [Thermotoga sp. RQ7]KFZ21598.1 signal peptidase I [Thermotoga neapolitana LA10]MDK2949540.1 signal peptidase [Thermotoga sp.]
MNLKKESVEWIKALLYALVAATIVRLYIFETMLVPTGSMIPTIQIGDRLFVEKITYTVREPQIGEIVVFWSPFVDERASHMLRLFDKFMDLFSPAMFRGHVKYVKRLVGKGGDVLEIKDGKLYVNGKIPDALKDRYYEPEGIFKYEDFYEWLYTASKLRKDKEAYRNFIYDLAREHGRTAAVLVFSLIGEEGLKYGEPFLPGLLNYFDPSMVYYDEKTQTYYIPGMIYHEFYEEYYSKLDLKKYIEKTEDGTVRIRVPEGFYFLMGDNTKESLDCRYFGFVPKDHIIGWPILRIWPLDRFGPIQKY